MSLTPQGRAALVAGAAAVGLGLAVGSLLAAALGASLLAALAWALLATRAPRARAARRVGASIAREGEPVQVEVGVESLEGARIEVEDALPPGLEAAEGDLIGQGARVGLAFAVVARVPGRFVFRGLTARVSDPLGLVERTHVIEAPGEIVALPRVEDLRGSLAASRRFLPASGIHLVGQAGGGSDFFALRDYQPGDTLRDVNWRASARTGRKLIVSQREMESQAEATVFLDARGLSRVGTVGNHAWADELRALASLAALLARRRDRPVVVRYGEGVETLRAAPGDAALAGVLASLLAREPAGGATLREAVDAALPRLRRRAPALVLSPLLDDPTVADAVAALRALELDVVVLALDGPAFLALAGEPTEEARAQRERTLSALRAHGVRVVDWRLSERLALALARGEA